MMKGKTNNPKGRPKGKPNRVTVDLRERVKLLIEKNFEKLESDFESLDPEKRLILLERFLRYTLPPLQSVIIQPEPPPPLPEPPRIYIVADQETKEFLEEIERDGIKQCENNAKTTKKQ